jgi:hypothetical protein
VYDANHKVIQSLDTPGLASPTLFAGLLSSMDATFQARMYLVWRFTDGSIYPLARADWQSVFRAYSDADGNPNLDSASITTANPMQLDNGDPATVEGPDYNPIVQGAGFWVLQ